MQLIIDNKDFREISVNKKVIYSFRKCKKDKEVIQNKLKNLLITPNVDINRIKELIEELKIEYKPHVKIPKGPFQWLSYYNKFIYFMGIYNKNKNLNNIDKKRVKQILKIKKNEFIKYINEMNEMEFIGLLANIKKLQLSKNFKEFFLLCKFYTDINKNVKILNNLKIKEDEEEIVFNDSFKINELITLKYKKLFKDNGIKNQYDINEDKYDFNENIIEKEIKKLKKDKGIGWDYIPHDSIIDLLKNKEEINTKGNKNIDNKGDEHLDNKGNEDNENKVIIINNIKRIFNDILYSRTTPPDEITTARLIMLNKNGENTGNINAIRPISIYGPIFKLLEKSIYEDLYKNIVPKLNKNQTGFVGILGTEVNIVKLRENVFRLYNEQHNNILITFIDFTSAYDTVDHCLLFKKLEEKLKINTKLLNVVKRIYTLAKVRINPLTESININSGVLQGSTLSPLLFNAFINDLINTLEKSTSDVLAYADDIAFVCTNKRQLNNTLKILKKWCANNKMTINFKKSGILIIRGSLKNNEERINIKNIELIKYNNDKCIYNLNKLKITKEDDNKNLDINLNFEINKHIGKVYNEDTKKSLTSNIEEIVVENKEENKEKKMINITNDDEEKSIDNNQTLKGKKDMNDEITNFEGIPIVKKYKYLGITLDDSLLPIKHLI